MTQLRGFCQEIEAFREYGKTTDILDFPDPEFAIRVYVNEFWTARQRAAHSLHEVSYRACFKPQLPRFFISRLTRPGDRVYDPFMGRGTTVLEAALLGRVPVGCDISPLSRVLVLPRLDPPQLPQIRDRLARIDLQRPCDAWDELLVFYHPSTLRAITNLRGYLLARENAHELDQVDTWIRMVATNRLTGHSPGFLSVYTLPPNQAVSVESQRKINRARGQVPPERDLREVILRKSRSLLADLETGHTEALRNAASNSLLLTASADDTSAIPDSSIALVVTSPPFLDVVDYQTDNWLRCWFNGIDASQVRLWQLRKVDEWQERMAAAFVELRRVLIPEGFVAFEVGEVRGGKVFLEGLVVPAAARAGLRPVSVLVNDQAFTKTSNCWGVDNLSKGTNTNRIVLLSKDG